jgi:hypothetical protein
MRWNGRRRRRRLIGGLAVGLVLAQAVGCSSCVDDARTEPPVVSGPQLQPRQAKITDKRLHVFPGAGVDGSP